MSTEEYRETVLKAMREYEKTFDHVQQFEITDALDWLYEIIRALPTEKRGGY